MLSLGTTTRNSKLVWHYMRPMAPALGLATVLAIVLGAVTAAVPLAATACMTVINAPKGEMLKFIDMFGIPLGPKLAELFGRGAVSAEDMLYVVPRLLVCLAAAQALLGLTQWFIWELASEVTAFGLRRDLAASFMHLAPAKRREGEARTHEETLASAITNDVKLLREYLVHFYGGLPREAAKIIFNICMLIMLSGKLTLIFLVGVAPVAALAANIGRKLRRRAAAALTDYSQLSEWLQQRLLGIETIKHYQTEPIEIDKMVDLSTNLYQRFLRAARVKARTGPILEGFAVMLMAGVFVVALQDVNAGRTTGTVELAFFLNLAILTQAIGKLGRYLNANREGAAAVDRLRNLFGFLLPLQQESATAAVTVGQQTQIECKQLTVRYPGAKSAALADFAYTFSGGKIYCLAGPSGAGKSTLLSTLLGLVRPAAGTVEFSLAAQPLVSGTTLRHVGFMPQKVLLLPDSLGANVAYPDADWDETRATEALRQVGLETMLMGFADGLSTRIGEAGSGVSGGQAQRILLARLWYHQFAYVLVDEGTSALDPETERTIHELLRAMCQRGAVVITIAHRQAAATAADVLLVLAEGRLIAAGSPKVVMKSQAYQRFLR